MGRDPLRRRCNLIPSDDIGKTFRIRNNCPAGASAVHGENARRITRQSGAALAKQLFPAVGAMGASFSLLRFS